MSKITCALSTEQIENLFKLTYKSMTTALEAGEAFNADFFMKDLFKKISDKKDIATATLFVQQIPSMIYTAAGLSNLLELDMGNINLRKLMSQYRNPETGFNAVLNEYAKEASPEEILAAVSVYENLVGRPVLNGKSSPVTGVDATERMKPFTTFSSTFIEFVKLNPNEKGVLTKEKLDPNKLRIYNTLNAIKGSIPDVITPFTEVNYKGQVIKIRAIQLTKLKQDMLDETTRKEVIKSLNVKPNTKSNDVVYKGEVVVQANERVALVLVNEKGDFLYFTEEGELSSEAEGGKIVYQFSRNVRDDINNPGMLRVTDIYGAQDQIMTPEELILAEAKAMGLGEKAYRKELEIAGTSYDERLAEIKAQQQKEFRALKAFNESVTKGGKAADIPLTGISLGIPTALVADGPTLGQLQDTGLITKENYKTIDLVKEPRDGFAAGTATMKINGVEFGIDRPHMTEEIATKIAHLLTNPNIADADKKIYIDNFMSNEISDGAKRYLIKYDHVKKQLTFSLREYTQYEAKKKNLQFNNPAIEIALIPENMKTIKDGLLAGYDYKGEYFPSRMPYNEAAIRDDLFYDYDVRTGTINTEPSSYINLLQTFKDPKVDLVEDKDPGFFNSYMHFSIDTKFEKEAQDAVNNAKTAEPTLTAEDRIIWGHPTLGKTFLRQSEDSIIDFDTDYKEKLNEKYGLAPGWKARSEFQRTNPDTWRQEIINLWEEAKQEARNTGKRLLASDMLILREFAQDIDKAINISKEEFVKRSKQRNDYVAGNTESWKDSIEIAIKNVDPSKIIQTSEYMSDLFSRIPKNETEEVEDEDFVVSSLNFGVAEEVEEISDEQFVNPEGAAQPSDNDDIPEWGFDRSADLPNDVTQEQIDAAKAWWESSPLSKFISIEHMTNIVNSNVFARFVAASKKLATPQNLGKIQINEATKGNYVDVYHEAWHVFSQLFLTKNQKIALYNEVRNSNPKWKNLSPKAIEEIIAEDFRNYALEPKPVDGMPQRNTLFRRILNFLKKLFGVRPNVNNTTDVATVKDLFEKLYFAHKDPSLLKDYKPLTDNVMWDVLNRGPQSLANSDAEFINSQDGKLMTASIDSIFSKLIDDSAAKYGFKSASMAILSDTFKTKKGITNREAAYEYAKDRLTEKLNKFTTEAQAIGLPVTLAQQNRLELLNDNIRVLTATLNNWGDVNNGMIKYHTETSTFAILKQNAKAYEAEVDEDAGEDAPSTDKSSPESTKDLEKIGDKAVGDKSLAEMASADTLFLLKSLFKVDAKGNRVQNRFGFDELADFPSVWNNVVRAIGGEKDPAVMQQKLAKAALTFPELKQLIDYKLPDLSKPKNTLDMSITTAFWQDFRKSRISYIQLLMAEQTDGTYVAEVMEASNETTSIIYTFRNKFKAAGESKYLKKTPKNTSLLKLDEIVKDFGTRGTFNSDKSYEFARAIGIALDDLSVIKKTLEEKPEYYGLQYIYSVVKKFAQIENDPKASSEAKRYLNKFKEDPIDVLTNPIPEGVIGEKTVMEKNLIVKLAELQGRYGKDASNFSVLNAERNLVFEHIEDFSASLQVNAINDVSKMSDLWTTNKYQFMSYLDPAKNPFTRRSKILDTIFRVNTSEDQYDRRKNKQLVLNVVSGTQLNDKTTGANTTSLDKQGKFIQEMHMLLKGGLQEFMRHASKSSSFGVHVEGGLVIGRGKGNDGHLYVDIDKFANGNEAELFAIDNIFTGYIASELERIIRFKANIDEYKNFVGYNRVIKDENGKELGLAGEFFTAFDNVLRKDTKDILLNNIDKMDIRNVNFLQNFLTNNPAVKLKITQDITDYFNEQTNLNNAFLNQKPYVEQNLMNRLDVFKLEPEDAQKVLVKAYTYNSWIHNFEMANLFYGDITLFDHSKDDGHKRIPGATSGGNGFRTDIGAQDYINEILNKSKVDPKTGAVTFTTYADVLNNRQKQKDRFKNINYKGTFNTAIIKDIERVSKYSDVIEKALTKDYRDRFKNATKNALLEQFTKSERAVVKNMTADQLKEKLIEKRIKAEMKAYNSMEEGDGQGYVTMDAYRALKVLEGKWLPEHQALYEKVIAGETINPKDITKFFPPYKIQNFGPLANAPITLTAMHKFSLMPLIPSVIKGSDLESLHEQMMASDIQYVTFQTGSKVGSITSNGKADKIYADDEQKSIIKPDANYKNGIQFTKNTVYLEYLKNVTNVPDKRKKQTIFSTQLRKLILEGLYDKGQVANPKFQPFITAYENAVKDYSRVLRLEILNEIGYEKKKNGKYEGKLDKFLELVQKELGRKEVPEHLIEYIGVTPQGTVTNDLSFHLEADEIEKILVSLINKKLVKQKVKGEALVQVASSMTNGLWDGSANLTKATDDEIRKFIGTNNLPFYNQTENGVIDFNKLYKNLGKDRLREILKSKEATLEDQARYWSPTYQNNLRAEINYLKDVIAGNKPKITEVSLPTSAMKVAVAMQGDFTNIFKAKDLDGNTIGIYGTKTVKNKQGEDVEVQELMFDESLKKLNELVKNEEWLNRDNNRKLVTMTAVRIPVQGLNSMEFMEVYHFLPPEAGNIIIPPSELVAKSGADYDIDKLTTFMPNIDSDGRFTESLMTMDDVEKLVTEQAADSAQAARIIETQKAAIENRLIQSTRNILSLPENFANLVRPNDTYLLKDIADELEPDVTNFDKYTRSHGEGYQYIADKTGKKKKVISPTRMLEVGFNIHKQEVNMGGKDGLGIVALKNALHPVFVALGAKMPKTYKSSIFDEKLQRYVDGLEDFDMRLLMRHNTINGNISLSDIYDVDKIDRISDLFNHKMNGLVDVEKDSWIFYIQGNVEVIPILSYLLMSGVPRQIAVKFVSQPLVREYVERQRVLNSPFSKVTGDIPEFSVKSQALADVAPPLDPDVLDKANKYKLLGILKSSKVKNYTLTTKANSEKRIQSATTPITKDALMKLLNQSDFKFNSIAKVVAEGDKKNIATPIDKTPFSTTNYYYTAKAASEVAKVTDFNLDELETLIEDYDTESPLAIAAFAHFVEIEKQIGGLEALQRVANPDTKTFKTIEEIIQREFNIDLVSEMSKLDPDLVKALQKESILSEFYDNELVKQLLQPLFTLRNNSKVSDFIRVALDKHKELITAKYGTGEDAVRRFINEYKNAIVNYIYQNHMTNSIDSKGAVTDLPDMYNDLEVVQRKGIPAGAKIEGNKILVDMDVLNADFFEKKYATNSAAPDSYNKRGLSSFTLDPKIEESKDEVSLFQTKSSFIKYVMEREYLRRSNPLSSLSKDKDFLALKKAIKQVVPENDKAEARAYEAYLNQKALYNTFNRRALMLMQDFSFTDHFFNVINDEAYTFLRDKYPVLNQFTEPKIATKEKVITINNKNIIKGEVAEGYYQNMLDLANPDVKKVIDPVDNKRLSDLFKMLPLVALYTHGIGYSKEGMNKILPYNDFMEKIFDASRIFEQNNLNEETFYNIFNKLVTNNRSAFKDYVTAIEDPSSKESVPEEPPIEVRETAGGGLVFGERPKVPAEPRMVTVPVMELSPNAKGLGAGLSTQTVLAKSKGNIVSEYPVTYDGTTYLDADQAFQLNKKGLTENGTGPTSQYSLMVEIMTEKFKQHPKLINAIKQQGGRDLLLNAIYQPTKSNTVWETGGQNYMILALNEAYSNVTGEVVRPPRINPKGVTDPETPVLNTLPSKSDKPTMTYAGIGSRETPQEVLSKMTEVSAYLDSLGYTLQTGFTFKNSETGMDEEGADKAFSDGSKNKILFGPSSIRVTTNGVTTQDNYNPKATEVAYQIVKEIHPAPERLKSGGMKLMARNTNQVFGKNLDSTVDFVIFYATETPGTIRPGGGTGQAVELARRKGIPTINMSDPNWRDQLLAAIKNRVQAGAPVMQQAAVTTTAKLTPTQEAYAKSNKIEQNFYDKKPYPKQKDSSGKVVQWDTYKSKTGKSSMQAALDGERTETTRSPQQIDVLKSIALTQGITNGIKGTVVWMEGQVDNIKDSKNIKGGWFRITSEPYTPNQADFDRYENWQPNVWQDRKGDFRIGQSGEWKSVRFERVNPNAVQPANVSNNTKTPIEDLNKRLDAYGSARVVLPSDFYEGARPKGRLNAFQLSIQKVADNLTILQDLNLTEFDFISQQDKQRLDALRPLAKELTDVNIDVSSSETRTVNVEKRFAQLTNQLSNEFVDIIGKYVEQQLGKKITSSKSRITTQPTAQVKPTAQPTQPVFDAALNEKLRKKLQELYPEIELKYTNETIDEINDPDVFNQRPEEFNKWQHNDIVREVLGDIRMAQWQKTMASDKNKMAINTTAINLISNEPLKYLSIDRNGFVYMSIEKLSSDIYKELGETIIPEKTLEHIKEFQDSMNSTEGLDVKYNEYVERMNEKRESIQKRLDKLTNLESLSAKELYKLLSETNVTSDDYPSHANFNFKSNEGRIINLRFDKNHKAELSEVIRKPFGKYTSTEVNLLSPEDDAYLDARISFKAFIQDKERLIKAINKIVKEPLERALSDTAPISEEKFIKNEIEYRYDITQYSEYDIVSGGLENQLENNLKTNGIIDDRNYLTDRFGFTPEGLLKLNKSKEYAELEAKQNKIKYILSNKNKFNKDYDQYEDSFGDGDVLAPMPGWFLNAFSVEVNGKYFDQLVSLAKPFIYQSAQEAYDALNDTGKTPRFQILVEEKNLNSLLTERINLNPKIDVTNKIHLLNQKDKNRIIGQANIKAMSVLIDAVNQKQDTLPHEYAHHYIAWFRDTPIVQEAIKKWGSEEALVQSIGEQVVKQKGEAYTWWQKFVKWILGQFDKLSSLQKEQLTQILTDAFLTKQDLTAFTEQMTQAPTQAPSAPVVAPVVQQAPVKAPVQINPTEGGILSLRTNPLEYTSGQIQALTEIESLISRKQGAYYLLAGYAGTGKTTIAENIARFAQQNDYRVEVIAPTNKAAKVLGTKLKEAKVGQVGSATIHATIYGAPDPKTKEWKRKPALFNRVFIIDESSMIDKNLMADIIEFTKNNNNIVIFMGDGFQLEQIGIDSGLFSSLEDPSIFNKKYGVQLDGGIMLTEVRRQTLDSEILKIATVARMDDKVYVPAVSTEDFEVVKAASEFQNQFLRSIKDDEDSVAVVATNDERIRLNNLARRVKFKDIKEPILPGETIVSVANSDEYRNSEVFNVHDIENVSEPFSVSFKYDNLANEVKFDVIMANVYNAQGEITNLLLIPELNQPSLYHQQVMEAALKNPKLMAYLQRENLIYVNKKLEKSVERKLVIGTYGYAITGHKSQGSQWDKVFVNQNFTAPSWNPARWYYTAMTRAARKVVVLQNPNQVKISADAVNKKLDGSVEPIYQQKNSQSLGPEFNKLSDFYSTLNLSQKEKIGTLEDLYNDYVQIPFDYSVEDYIEYVKNCKL